MRIFVTTLATIGALSATSATAQSLPDNMYIDGYISSTSAHTTGFDETLSRASLNFGITPAKDSGFAVGFSLGLDAVKYDGWDISEMVLYPAVTFALGDSGLLSVGVPRPVVNYGYIPENTMAHSSTMELFLSVVNIDPSMANYYYLYYPDLHSNDVDMYGLRYDGEFGNTKIGASAHQVDFSGLAKLDITSVAFQHQLGQIGGLSEANLFGAVEQLKFGGKNWTSYTLGAEAGLDKLRTGLILSKSNFTATGVYLTTANLYADYKITDDISVLASTMHMDAVGESARIHSLGAEYRFLNGGYVNATYSDQTLYNSDGFYEVTLGWRF